MNRMIMTAMALAAGVALADGPAKADRPKMTREEVFEKMMTATGGFIDTEGTGAKVVLVDARKERDKAAERAVSVLRNTYRIPVTNEVASIAEGACPAKFAGERLKAAQRTNMPPDGAERIAAAVAGNAE